MAQKTNTFYKPFSILLVNNDITISNTETTVLTSNVIGFQNFGLAVTIISGGAVTINIYGSADNVNMYAIQMNALSISTGTQYVSIPSALTGYITVTATSVSQSVINCQLIGEQ